MIKPIVAHIFPFLTLISILCINSHINAQQKFTVSKIINWENPAFISLSKYEKAGQLAFKNAQYEHPRDVFPYYQESVLQPGDGEITSVKIISAEYQPLNEQELAIIQGKVYAKSNEIQANVVYQNKRPFTEFMFYPFKSNGNSVPQKMVSFTLEFVITPFATPKSGPKSTASNSVLAGGQWFKVAITNTGVHKLTRAQLIGMGMSSSVNPKNIRVYGNGGAPIPERNSDYYPDDLIENAIFVSGENDNSFDESDFVLFYAQGPLKWQFDGQRDMFRHTKNLYSDSAYYFITADLGPGKRLPQIDQSTQSPNITHTIFDDYAVIENDEENLIKSGREWFGNRMEVVNSHTFNLNFPNLVSGPQKLNYSIVGRNNNLTAFSLNINGQLFRDTTLAANTSDYLALHGRKINRFTEFNTSSSALNITLTKNTSSGIGWLDFLIVNVKRNLIFNGNSLAFRAKSGVAPGTTHQFNLSNVNAGTLIWDVTDIFNVQIVKSVINGTTLSFALDGSEIREFVAVNPSGNFTAPISMGTVGNQNLHNTSAVDFVIVTHPSFISQANRLAEHHRLVDGMRVAVALTTQVYNEFSGGSKDIAGIRNFMRMFYERHSGDDAPKYLLLFGDGSYDFKNRIAGNNNFIPTYESAESLNPIGSYASDDFFGMLDPTEGFNIHTIGAGQLDIGVGRFPVSNADQANALVNKVIHYATSRDCLNDWRNMLSFIADDEDSSTHLDQQEDVIDIIKDRFPVYNFDKIYLDAYQQTTGSGGQRYPQVNIDITNRIERGTLIWNFAGHGGELGLTQERVVTIPEINAWKNINNLTLFITATCEFSRFDNPELVSAGEYAILNKDGAGIALFTTVRLTFSSSNKALNSNIMDTIFSRQGGSHLRLGEVLQFAKNATGSSFNNRSFALLGDPALMLAFPKYDIETLTIKGEAVGSQSDTLKALERITITGRIVYPETSNIVSNFNGVCIPTVFDKESSYNTLSNDPTSPARQFNLRNNIIFRGPVTVKNGNFSFTFVVPKDIRYEYGEGKISYYARHANTLDDAHGYYNNLIVGGFSDNPIADDAGPIVQLFMNNTQFVNGGMTDENPDFLALVEDDIGINTVGTGIGHDITAILDNNTANPIVLNDFYEAAHDDYTKGSVRYPYRNLSEGSHTIRFKVWDVANNSSEATIDFVVVKNQELALSHVLNYPNPFSTQTNFFFEYNQPNVPVDVEISIFTVSGKIVKNIYALIVSSGFRSEPISWDGTDDYNDKIGRGVYVYRLRVRTPEGKMAEKYEKLVLLN